MPDTAERLGERDRAGSRREVAAGRPVRYSRVMSPSRVSLTEAREYLRGPMSAGALTLFTGAGFSRGACNELGRAIPGVNDLKASIWALVASSAADDRMSLQDVF